ncbi:MAG: RNA polymerase sigma factor RpoD/SigA [Elusimicrobiota bacterium]
MNNFNYTAKDWNSQKIVNQYLKEIKDFPLLSREEEREIIKRAKDGDREAINALICSNLRFVVSVAINYQNQGLSMPELINEGNLGLIDAIEKYKPSYNVKFISYAVWWIRQSIIKALYEKVRTVRISAEKEVKLKKIKKLIDREMQKSSQDLCSEDLAKKLRSNKKEMDEILILENNNDSLDAIIEGKTEKRLIDVIPDNSIEPPDSRLMLESAKKEIKNMLDLLNEQEKKIITLYFGLDNDVPFNLEQIGKIMDISKERVRQVKKRGLEKIQIYYKDNKINPDYALGNG